MSIPEKALSQHVAILGKTGSGKTSTEKLVVEQVVAEDYRVCILDAVKSDWWGITSSADGKKPGLPFRILGGPHGHVPLHSSAGAVIGQLVGSGKLPLSIIDMADFEAGGLQRFFVDFAPALMRSARGVIYLVIEEAHEFAPKERSGIGLENMAIHWAKKLATAGRSKGIRLIVATQRAQALHNAVLGSCETLIAHRLTTPADQEPVLKWLKANTDKETLESVSRSLSSLPTGTGWLCSGEARIFKQVAFPKFKTYDNAATPTKDGPEIQVKTAHVDQDELRSIIGVAVAEAEANDPKKLRARIAELEKVAKKVAPAAPDSMALSQAEDRGFQVGLEKGIAEGYQQALGRLQDGKPTTAIPKSRPVGAPQKPQLRAVESQVRTPQPKVTSSAGSGEVMGAAEKAFLKALAQHGALTRDRVALYAGYSVKSRHVDNTLGALRSKVWAEGARDAVSITPAGVSALGAFDPLPTGEKLRTYWLGQVGIAEKAFLDVLFDIYPETATRDGLATAAGYSPLSRHVDNTLGRLRSLGLVEGDRAAIKASDDLFQEAA